MYRYKLTFDNGTTFNLSAENLGKAENKIVAYMESHSLKFCEILCPNGVVRQVAKTGEWHWQYDGYTFR